MGLSFLRVLRVKKTWKCYRTKRGIYFIVVVVDRATGVGDCARRNCGNEASLCLNSRMSSFRKFPKRSNSRRMANCGTRSGWLSGLCSCLLLCYEREVNLFLLLLITVLTALYNNACYLFDPLCRNGGKSNETVSHWLALISRVVEMTSQVQQELHASDIHCTVVIARDNRLLLFDEGLKVFSFTASRTRHTNCT